MQRSSSSKHRSRNGKYLQKEKGFSDCENEKSSELPFNDGNKVEDKRHPKNLLTINWKEQQRGSSNGHPSNAQISPRGIACILLSVYLIYFKMHFKKSTTDVAVFCTCISL